MKPVSLILLFVLANASSGRAQKKVSVYADFHVNATLYDRTLENNGTGFGGGLQAILNAKGKFRPSFEIAGDGFGGNKVLYLTADGRPIYAKSTVGGILMGSSYELSEKICLNAAAGLSFFNDAAYFALKPAIGLYFPSNKRLVLKISLTHIFQSDDISNDSFGYLNIGLGIRLF